jgi:hypothetical protein
LGFESQYLDIVFYIRELRMMIELGDPNLCLLTDYPAETKT